MGQPREAIVRYFTQLNDYRDKETAVPTKPDEPESDDEPCKAIVVKYLWGDRVRLRGGDEQVGRVVSIKAPPGAVLYEISWPESREISEHYEFELEAAD